MPTAPELGLYVSSTDPDLRLVVERVDVIDDSYFLVSVVEEKFADDSMGVGEEYDPSEWEGLVRAHGLRKA